MAGKSGKPKNAQQSTNALSSTPEELAAAALASIRQSQIPTVQATPTPPSPPQAIQAKRFLYRIPSSLRKIDGFNYESVPYYSPRDKIPLTPDCCFAVCARASFSHPSAMYRNERGYVRDLICKATKTIFYQRLGSFPISGISQRDR